VRRAAVSAVLLLLLSATAFADGEKRLILALEPFHEALIGDTERFSIGIRLTAEIRGRSERVAAVVSRHGADSWSLSIAHRKFPLRIARDERRTVLILPAHRTAIVADGRGGFLSLDQIGARLFGYAEREEGVLYEMIERLRLEDLVNAIGFEPGGSRDEWVAGDLTIVARPDPASLDFRSGDVRVRLDYRAEPAPPPEVPEGFSIQRVEREELERVIGRGIRRGLSLLVPPGEETEEERTVENGRLRIIDGHRVVTLSGTPTQIGRAHARLLEDEAVLCIDSTLHLVGLAYTLDRGRWFPDELRDAWRRLAPHIPEDHLREMDALADGVPFTRETVRIANVFPELFHCSGFAMFGEATKGGKLYHGRVLDYMTEIGLQDCATIFIVKPTGKRAFVNVGYAGFIGSVSGMNDRGISLGEMGGRGEGKWDGVPMATLMRRALEECETLDEVVHLWRTSPRTCEYYYVVADGKVPTAVAISATPEGLDVLRPGDSHPQLGAGFEDAVVLSGGGRLKELRRRVSEGHGTFDAQSAIRLMDRPVAMRSNLHNVLFVPEDLVLYIAHARGKNPACNEPYLRLDLASLLR